MRRRLTLFVMIVLPLGSAACIRDADPLEVNRDPLQVHAMLAAGADSVTVLVSRPAVDLDFYRAVSGADVRLIHDGVAVQLFERTDGTACAVAGRTPIGGGSGCYTAALSQPVAAGGVYDLEVLVGAERVTGQTRVPHAVTITTPESSTYPIECAPTGSAPPSSSGSCWGSVSQPSFQLEPLAVLEVLWTPPAGATRVDVMFRPTRIVRQGAVYPGQLCEVDPPTMYRAIEAPRGNVRWPVMAIHCGDPIDDIGWDSIHMEATVAVYDEAYATYLDAVLDRDAARFESVSAGLDGALGVFGAVNATAHAIELIRLTTPQG